MVSQNTFARTPLLLAGVLTTVCLCAGSAQADVISSTPNLPVVGVPNAASSGAGCFAADNLYVTGGNLTLTSVATSHFDVNGQDILANVFDVNG